MKASEERAKIFKQYITYETVRHKFFYYLVDISLHKQIEAANEAENVIMVQYYLELLTDETYHFNVIQNSYPDTYNFLIALENGSGEIGSNVE